MRPVSGPLRRRAGLICLVVAAVLFLFLLIGQVEKSPPILCEKRAPSYLIYLNKQFMIMPGRCLQPWESFDRAGRS